MKTYYINIRNGDISAVYTENGEFVEGTITKCGEYKDYSNEKDFLDNLNYLNIDISEIKGEEK